MADIPAWSMVLPDDRYLIWCEPEPHLRGDPMLVIGMLTALGRAATIKVTPTGPTVELVESDPLAMYSLAKKLYGREAEVVHDAPDVSFGVPPGARA